MKIIREGIQVSGQHSPVAHHNYLRWKTPDPSYFQEKS